MDDFKASGAQFASGAIYGCVSYTSIHTEGTRQTRFAYHLSRIKDGSHYVLLTPEVDITKEIVDAVDMASMTAD